MSATEEKQVGLGYYTVMRLIRSFEEAVQKLFERGEIHGTIHLYNGEEACAVGVCSGLEPGDLIAGTYRGHGHAIAKGVDVDRLMAEMMGRATGICGGRAGSMNVISADDGLVGCFGIVGGSIAAATGAALSAKTLGSGAVAVGFFGDGATHQGYYAECLNFAQVYDLPVVFVCENNLYMEYTPIEKVTAGLLADRPKALGITTQVVDGNDVWAVREAADAAISQAREGAGPAFLELLTYRFVGHARSDPGAYRKPGELERWEKRDPLKIARERLMKEFGVSEEELEGADREVVSRIERAIEFGRASEFPDPGQPMSEFKEVDVGFP